MGAILSAMGASKVSELSTDQLKLSAEIILQEGLKCLKEAAKKELEAREKFRAIPKDVSSMKDKAAAFEKLSTNLSQLIEEGKGSIVVQDVKGLFDEYKKYQPELTALAKSIRGKHKSFHCLLPLFKRKPADNLGDEDFEPGVKKVAQLMYKKVLCVGAGGLGCEILKNLALSGVKNITVIDLDTIDVSNLNRQFLFRRKDIGKPKAQVAAEFIEKRCGVKVTWYKKPIQEFSQAFYRGFDIVIAGLDNVKARLWLNLTLFNLVQRDSDGDPIIETIVPLIDGGTEGFKGQTRFFLYPFTSCFECSMSLLTGGPKTDLCTIRSTPRIPEHCIQYALLIEWPKLLSITDHKTYKMKTKAQQESSEFKDLILDKDDPEHMAWLYERAKERANQFGITGVTYNLTMQYTKNIIPAIASTNGLVAASCTNEVIKYLTECNNNLDNYYFYNGTAGCYTRTFEFAKNPDCFTCSDRIHNIDAEGEMKLKQLLDKINSDLKAEVRGITNSKGSNIFNAGIKSTLENLDKPLKSFYELGKQLTTMFVSRDGSKPMKYSLVLTCCQSNGCDTGGWKVVK